MAKCEGETLMPAINWELVESVRGLCFKRIMRRFWYREDHEEIYLDHVRPYIIKATETWNPSRSSFVTYAFRAIGFGLKHAHMVFSKPCAEPEGFLFNEAMVDTKIVDELVTKDLVAKMMKRLTPEERDLIQMRNYDGRTLESISGVLGITKERVRQKCKAIYNKMRRAANARC